ncbi:MAG: hypothetical protein QXK12_02280 [Candidatus Nezhaarchaeales archaeon]
MYWEDIKLIYNEIKRTYEEVLAESKTMVEAFYELWQKIREGATTERNDKGGLRRSTPCPPVSDMDGAGAIKGKI